MKQLPSLKDWAERYGDRYGSGYLQSLKDAGEQQAKLRLLGLKSELSAHLCDEAVLAFEKGFLDFIATQATDDWTQFAARLLQEDRAAGLPVGLENEETVSQILGVLGLRIVFGIYFGNLVRLPVRTAGLLAKSHPWRFGSELIRRAGRMEVMEIHLPKLTGKRLSPGLNEQSHHRIADYLRQNPSCAGVFNANWYYDPAVGRISPNLAYLSEFASTNGAMLAPIGTDAGVIADATLTSRTRRQHYETGSYRPTRFARFWPRRKAIRWAGEHRSGADVIAISKVSVMVGDISHRGESVP